MFLLLYISLLSVLNATSSYISKPLIQWFNKPSNEQKDIQQQITDLVAEQSQISMVDNFAQHAKVQRKINKLQTELVNISKDRTEKCAITFGTQAGVRVVTGLITLINIYVYKNTPVLIFPSNYNFFPIGSIMSYPCSTPGSVSVIFWTMVMSCICHKVIK